MLGCSAGLGQDGLETTLTLRARTAEVICIDAVWLAVQLLDMQAEPKPR
jgi:hypothetical protein